MRVLPSGFFQQRKVRVAGHSRRRHRAAQLVGVREVRRAGFHQTSGRVRAGQSAAQGFHADALGGGTCYLEFERTALRPERVAGTGFRRRSTACDQTLARRVPLYRGVGPAVPGKHTRAAARQGWRLILSGATPRPPAKAVAVQTFCRRSRPYLFRHLGLRHAVADGGQGEDVAGIVRVVVQLAPQPPDDVPHRP